MAVRGDVTIDWSVSPRIIEVADPSVLITVQDIVDTCRTLESALGALDDDYLIDAAGKDDLGGGVSVGITVTLNDAKIKFAARAGPTWTLCDINGGNLVAKDSAGDAMSPVEPSAFITVVMTSSSSATLQELTAIQYSSFNEGVTIDVVGGSSGTVFPIGTPEQPVDNLTDAQTIAVARGLKILYIVGNITIASGDDVSGYHLHGEGDTMSTITMATGSINDNTMFATAILKGELGDGSDIDHCTLDNVSGLNGHIHHCALKDTITVNGTTDSHMIDCYATGRNLIINMGGSGRGLEMRRFAGSFTLENFTDATKEVCVDFSSGKLTIDPTVTAGLVDARGSGLVVDNSTGVTVVDVTGITNPEATGDASAAAVQTVLAPNLSQLQEVFTLMGLDISKPLLVTKTARTAGDIYQVIEDTPDVQTRVTRTV